MRSSERRNSWGDRPMVRLMDAVLVGAMLISSVPALQEAYESTRQQAVAETQEEASPTDAAHEAEKA